MEWAMYVDNHVPNCCGNNIEPQEKQQEHKINNLQNSKKTAVFITQVMGACYCSNIWTMCLRNLGLPKNVKE